MTSSLSIILASLCFENKNNSLSGLMQQILFLAHIPSNTDHVGNSAHYKSLRTVVDRRLLFPRLHRWQRGCGELQIDS
jgi:hypothetical protein